MQIVPAELVGVVREAVCDELQDATEALTDVISPKTLQPPGSHRERRSALNAVCRMLDVLGWEPRDPPVDVEVNLREHGLLLLQALRTALQTVEAMLTDSCEGRESDPTKRAELSTRVGALRELLAGTEERVRHMRGEDQSRLVRSPGELGTVLRARLREVGLSRGEVSDLTNVDEAVLVQLERGESVLGLADVLRVLHLAGLDIEVRPRSAGTARRGEQLVIPAERVGDVRNGLHIVLGGITQELRATSEQQGRERHPEWYGQDRERVECAFVLLDRIGWGEPQRPVDVVVDLYAHHWALSEALDAVLPVAEDDLGEVEAVDAERAKREQPPVREETTRRVLALQEFACEVKGRIEAALLTRGAPA